MEPKEYREEKKRCEAVLKRNPAKESDEYLCFIPEDPDYAGAFGIKGRAEVHDIYRKTQNGYKWAAERTPYFPARKRVSS
jgi:hypothetical protein